MKNFVIVSSPRSGTRMLSSILNNVPGFLCWNEILRPDILAKPQQIGHPNNSIFNGCNDEKSIIDTIFDTNKYTTNNIDAVGFVTHIWNGLEESSRKFELTDQLNPWPFLVSKKDLIIINLQRKNKFRRLISHLVANIGEWHWLNGKDKPKTNKIHIDRDRAIANIKQANIKADSVKEIFSNHHIYDIFYEEFTTESININSYIIGHLTYYALNIDINDKDAVLAYNNSSTNKIIEDYSSVVENWDEVKDLDVC